MYPQAAKSQKYGLAKSNVTFSFVNSFQNR